MRGAADRNFEEIQKAVDKRKTACYTLKVAADKRKAKVQNFLKKVLDKRNEVMYNSNVPPEAACTL